MTPQEREIKLKALYELRESVETLITILEEGVSEMINSEQVMELLGVSSTTLARYRQGRVPKGKPAFPSPKARSNKGKLYLRSEIKQWMDVSIC